MATTGVALSIPVVDDIVEDADLSCALFTSLSLEVLPLLLVQLLTNEFVLLLIPNKVVVVVVVISLLSTFVQFAKNLLDDFAVDGAQAST